MKPTKCPEIVLKFAKKLSPEIYFFLLGPLLYCCVTVLTVAWPTMQQSELLFMYLCVIYALVDFVALQDHDQLLSCILVHHVTKYIHLLTYLLTYLIT